MPNWNPPKPHADGQIVEDTESGLFFQYSPARYCLVDAPAPTLSYTIEGQLRKNTSIPGVALGISGVEVDILDPATGNIIQTVVTDSSGVYRVTISEDQAIVSIKQSQPELDGLEIVTGTFDASGSTAVLALDANAPTVASAFYNPVANQQPGQGDINGFVFCDRQDENALAAGNVAMTNELDISLMDASGNVIASQTTDANGFYEFKDVVAPASYTLSYDVVSLEDQNLFWTSGGDFQPDGTVSVTSIDGDAVTKSVLLTEQSTQPNTKVKVTGSAEEVICILQDDCVIEMVVLDASGCGELELPPDGYQVQAGPSGTPKSIQVDTANSYEVAA